MVQLDHAIGGEEQEDASRDPLGRRLCKVPWGYGGVDERNRQLSGQHYSNTAPLQPDGTRDASADVGAGRGEQPQQFKTTGHFVLE